MPLRLVRADEVRRLLPMDRCIGLMRQAMALAADERTVQPIRRALRTPDGKGLLSMMPGYVAEPAWLGIKVVSVFPGNFGTDLGSHQGMVLLFNTENGAPAAIIDGREVTAIRTAAASAVATDVLARENVSSLAIFGYGEQAHNHLVALNAVRRFTDIRVWGRDYEVAKAFCKAQSDLLGFDILPAETAQSIAGADVVCTTTAAAEPFFEASRLRRGQHLNVVGSSLPTTSEIDVETVARARLYVDLKVSALELAGDFLRAKAANLVADDHILGSIGEVMRGTVPGRRGAGEITMFKSLGMICEDLVSADFILAQAEAQGVGQVVDW